MINREDSYQFNFTWEKVVKAFMNLRNPKVTENILDMKKDSENIYVKKLITKDEIMILQNQIFNMKERKMISESKSLGKYFNFDHSNSNLVLQNDNEKTNLKDVSNYESKSKGDEYLKHLTEKMFEETVKEIEKTLY